MYVDFDLRMIVCSYVIMSKIKDKITIKCFKNLFESMLACVVYLLRAGQVSRGHQP